MPRSRISLWVSDRGHLRQTHDHLGLSGIHVHFPDPGLTRCELLLVNVLDADIFGSFEKVHPLVIVSQCRGTVGRQIINWPRQGPSHARAEVVGAADELLAIV